MIERLPDGKCGRYNELWSHTLFYDDRCDGCKSIVQIGKRKFCSECSPRVSLHQVVRAQIGCTFCKHYTKNLDSAVCLKCMEEHPNAENFCMMEAGGGDRRED